MSERSSHFKARLEGRAGNASRRGTDRFHLARFMATFAVVIAGALVPLSPAQAVLVTPPVNSGGFEIDGDVPVNNGGPYDWGNSGSVINDGIDDATQFGNGGSEAGNPSSWGLGAGGAAGKADIIDAYVDGKVVGGQTWAFFAIRRDSTVGTTALSFEFNQLPNSPGGQPRPTRSYGDLLVAAQQVGNTSFSIADAFFWTPQSAFTGGCLLIPGYTPAAGWCPTTLPAAAFYGTTGENGAFAEGALNLSAVFGQTCLGSFAVLNIRTRASTSRNSALHDWVMPINDAVPGTCGQISVAKVNQFGESVPGATFEISPDPKPGVAGGLITVTEGQAGDADGVANGFLVLDPVEPDTYTVTETAAPPGYLLPPPGDRSQTVVVAEAAQVELIFEDTLPWQPLTASKTAIATYDASYAWSIGKTASPQSQWTPDGTPARFDYTVTLTAGEETRSGFEVHGVISIANPNAHAMVVTIADQLSDGTDCTVTAADAGGAAGLQVSVPAGGVDLTYTCAGLDSDASGTNTATLDWSRADYPQTQGDVNDPAGAPAVTVTASRDYVFGPDQLTDETVTVTDTLRTFDPAWVVDWAENLVDTRDYSLDLTGEGGTCVNRDNTATVRGDSGVLGEADATVELCTGMDLEITKNATLTYDRAYNWRVTKTGPGTVFVGGDDFVGPADYQVVLEATDWTDTNQTLAGTITVRNPNDWDIPADVTDIVTVDGVDYDCTVINGAGAVITGNTSMDFSYRCTGIAQGDYVGTNTATVTWDGVAFASPNSSHDVTVPVVVDEDTEPLNDTVTLTDSMGQTFESLPWAEVKAAGGQTFTYSADITGDAGVCVPVDNTVTIDQTGIADTATTQVCSPSVAKTADAQFGNEYGWDVTKSVDSDFQEIAPDGTATFSYVVEAVPSDEQLIYWNWVGTITVANPSTTEALTVDITDIAGVADATCTVDGGTAVTVPADGEITVGYTCESTTKSADPGTNTAVASFGDESVSLEIPVVFTEVDSVNAVIDVQDSVMGTLGTATWNPDGTPTRFVYNMAYEAGEPGVCASYPNIAEVPHQTAEIDVRVCTEAPLTVTKTANAGLTRTYHWSLDKTVEDDSLTGESGRFTYHVGVRAEPSVDSAWTLSGVVGLTNPNTYDEGGIVASVADLPTGLAEGDTCSITGAGPILVDAGATVDVPYSCILSAAPSADAGNSAMATWDPPGEATEASASSGVVPVEPAPTVEIDKRVRLVDDLTAPGSAHVIAGPIEWSEGLDDDYTYTIRQHVDPGKCETFTNTAALVSLDEAARVRPAARAVLLTSASVDTRLCAPKKHAQGAPLPDTGSPRGLLGMAWLGWLSLAAGVGLVGWARRRRTTTE